MSHNDLDALDYSYFSLPKLCKVTQF